MTVFLALVATVEGQQRPYAHVQCSGCMADQSLRKVLDRHYFKKGGSFQEWPGHLELYMYTRSCCKILLLS